VVFLASASRSPGEGPAAFAIGNDEQYRPVRAVGDQWVRVGGEGLLVCHASRALRATERGADSLVVAVHGALRDSDRYLARMQDAARLAGSDALIVAPQFLTDADAAAGLPEGALCWDVEGWKGGYPALRPAPVSSFAAMDSLLDQLAPDPGGTVIVFGNSAGGQFVNRYAAVGAGPDALAERGITVRFVIANPSTYLYFDRERPVQVSDDAQVNRWRYGFDDPPPYVRAGPRQSLERYLRRDVTIVLGERDTDTAALLLEVSPPAMAQGKNRLERGVRYGAHVRELARAAGLSTRHGLIRLARVGHDAGEVMAAAETRRVMFGA
jgi:pimeloyl-ACP methyl ester carboxylesterase